MQYCTQIFAKSKTLQYSDLYILIAWSRSSYFCADPRIEEADPDEELPSADVYMTLLLIWGFTGESKNDPPRWLVISCFLQIRWFWVLFLIHMVFSPPIIYECPTQVLPEHHVAAEPQGIASRPPEKSRGPNQCSGKSQGHLIHLDVAAQSKKISINYSTYEQPLFSIHARSRKSKSGTHCFNLGEAKCRNSSL